MENTLFEPGKPMFRCLLYDLPGNAAKKSEKKVSQRKTDDSFCRTVKEKSIGRMAATN
jgi:hypothetical protein